MCINHKNLSDLPDPCNAMFHAALKSIMKWCWAFDPDERPFFSQLNKLWLKSKHDICVLPSTIMNVPQMNEERTSNKIATASPAYGSASMASTVHAASMASPAYGAAFVASPAYSPASMISPAPVVAIMASPAYGAALKASPVPGDVSMLSPIHDENSMVSPALGANSMVSPVHVATSMASKVDDSTSSSSSANGHASLASPIHAAASLASPAYGAPFMASPAHCATSSTIHFDEMSHNTVCDKAWCCPAYGVLPADVKDGPNFAKLKETGPRPPQAYMKKSKFSPSYDMHVFCTVDTTDDCIYEK